VSIVTVPSVLVIDVPPARRGPGLPLGRYYPIVVETEFERDEIERLIATAGATLRIPDMLERPPSNLRTDRIMIARYEPPAPDWPWLSVTCWPQDFVAAAHRHQITMARGCYTMELFENARDVDTHQRTDVFGRHDAQPIRCSPCGRTRRAPSVVPARPTSG
jgi:hypothetical protein